jgi:hypothetical protein
VVKLRIRRYILRETALELFCADGRNQMIVVNSQRDAKLVKKQIKKQLKRRVLSGDEQDVSVHTQAWVEGKMCTFQYIMYLNTVAGRSYNDLTQYPVFPWVIADYTSPHLDLGAPATFRDLSKPMGALSEARAQLVKDRFDSFHDPTTPPFHWGSHYSSSGTVCYFLSRVEPFASHLIDLQGGRWDDPDRMFHSVADAWNIASNGSTAQVMELVPEFFYSTLPFINKNRFLFGVKQNRVVLGDVELPPWANGSPTSFVKQHQSALESDYVSEHISDWIDLIFGYKQRGEAAVASLNVFHHLSYEGAVDIDAIKDPIDRAATIDQINNFGQTPRQLFTKPHPKRKARKTITLPELYLIPEKLRAIIARQQDPLDVGIIGSLLCNCVDGKLFYTGAHRNALSPTAHVSWLHPDHSVRVWENGKETSVFEGDPVAFFSCCAVCRDGNMFALGSESGVVRLYHKSRAQGSFIHVPEADRFCYHESAIVSLACSREYSVVVSADASGKCYLWDLNETTFVKELCTGDDPVLAIDIHDLTGDIITCSRSAYILWSVNGDLLAYHSVSSSTANSAAEAVTCCLLCPSPEGYMALQATTLFTGHANGNICVWNVDTNIEVEAGVWRKLQEQSGTLVDRNEFNELKNTNRLVTSPFPDPRPTQMLLKYVLPCFSPVVALSVASTRTLTTQTSSISVLATSGTTAATTSSLTPSSSTSSSSSSSSEQDCSYLMRVTASCSDGSLLHWISHEALSTVNISSNTAFHQTHLPLNDFPSLIKLVPQMQQLKDHFDSKVMQIFRPVSFDKTNPSSAFRVQMDNFRMEQ